MTNADTVRRITAFRSNGYPVISVYVSTDVRPPGLRARIGNLLHQIRPLATDPSLGRGARASIGTDLSRIESSLARERDRPGSVAVFACSGRNMFEEVALPRRVRDRIVVDAAPWVRPMSAVLDEHPRYGVVLVTPDAARVWELSAGDLLHPRGLGTRADTYDVLLIGGHPPDVAGFVAALPRAVSGRVVATFPVDPATATPAQLRGYAAPLADSHQRGAQLHRVAQVFDVYESGGLAVLGLAPCLQAGSVGAVRALVVEDDASVGGVVCDACGWLGSHGRLCAACECPVRPSDDVVDELVESVIDQGGSVRRIRVDSPLRGWTAAASL
ncbi:MAG: peptide chain release factor subunit 1, partial [Micromonosporaceae bacterium]|nr:peptide chain release factor subunit 1 [Micromonosporaceae bacterium]